ncbi:thioesterase domain-containing protein, partial [Streptomyces ziwulingensis]|uniref:thioesterase domain-containing protein n=1 Tax=Streptomyces ziwulingensis TaxID=1045501 RepID=UPI0031EDAF57
HPDVAQAAVISHDVRDTGAQLIAYAVAPAGDPTELRGYLAERLPGYLVPSAVVLLDRMPLTPHHKVDRAALPEPVFAERAYRAPRTEDETVLAELFEEVLGTDRVGIDDDFFALGGHSLLVVRLVSRIAAATGVPVPIRTVFQHSTVAGLATRFRGAAGPAAAEDPLAPVFPLRTEGQYPPLWMIRPGAGLCWAYLGFVEHLPERQLYGIQAREYDPAKPPTRSVREMVDDYLAHLLEIQPEGPYHLLGWSAGGTIAHAMAVELQRRGHEVALLAMLDSATSGGRGAENVIEVNDILEDVKTRELVRNVLGERNHDSAYLPLLRTMATITVEHAALLDRFTTPVFDGDLLFFTATVNNHKFAAQWTPYISGAVHEHEIPCEHRDMVQPAHAALIGAVITAALADTENSH